MASLNTFGAIMTYAIELETHLRDYYQAAGASDLAAASDKRRVKLGARPPRERHRDQAGAD